MNIETCTARDRHIPEATDPFEWALCRPRFQFDGWLNRNERESSTGGGCAQTHRDNFTNERTEWNRQSI